MTEAFTVVVIGAGPAGLSAAARAAALGVPHVLLERTDHLADTIFKYQKGKHVMATPDELPLRAHLPFAEGRRETVLAGWEDGVRSGAVNVRFNADVVAIDGAAGAFEVRLADGDVVRGQNVVLAIGTQGNLRTLAIPGADNLGLVQYQLDDPHAYADEDIVVIGAGDSAIENAVALSEQNEVTILNRRGEFARAKPGNLQAVLGAADAGELACLYNAAPTRLEPGRLVVRLDDGEAVLPVHRIIARLGSTPPRAFLEKCGIELPSKDPAAVPEVSARYESNRKGLYVIGALAGYPLIKQAMNQGYEVVEYIRQHDVAPADEPLLAARMGHLGRGSVADVVDLVHRAVPLLAAISTLQLRELLLDSRFHVPRKGDVVFERNDYSDSLYCVVEGEVEVLVDPNDASKRIRLRQGDFFGEGSLLSGRRRAATVVAGEGAFLVETPRTTVVKLRNSVVAVKRLLDEAAMVRTLQAQLIGPVEGEDLDRLRALLPTCQVREWAADEVLFREGDAPDALHLVRKGSVTVVRAFDGHEVVLGYVPAGHYVGEMAILNRTARSATVRAAIATETIALPADAFQRLLQTAPGLRQRVEQTVQRRLVESAHREVIDQASDVIQFLVQQGLGEATDVLLIDESLCVACDNCERACAATHKGTSRLDRQAGPTFATLHVPTSCRHCEDPKCMSECPPDAIHRSSDGEVYIDDSCIGCGNCERNCPYGVIQMSAGDAPTPSALEVIFPWLSRILRNEPAAEAHKTAVKCDMCRDLPGGPACVASCPTGAAIRVSPQEFFDITHGGG